MQTSSIHSNFHMSRDGPERLKTLMYMLKTVSRWIILKMSPEPFLCFWAEHLPLVVCFFLLIKLTVFPASIYPKIVHGMKDNLSLPSTWKPRNTPRNWKVMASFSTVSWEMGTHGKKNLIFHVTPHVTPFLEHWSNQEFIWLLKEPKA